MESFVSSNALVSSDLPINSEPSYGLDSGLIPSSLPQGSYVIYEIQRDNTLYDLAEYYYNDPNQWVNIFEADGTTFTDYEARRIPIGTKVYLPVPGGADSLAPTGVNTLPDDSFSLPGNWQPYVIQDGDRLWNLANDILGNPLRWIEIRAEDGTTFTSEEARQLQPGTTVYIPVDTNAAEPANIYTTDRPNPFPGSPIIDVPDGLFNAQTQIPVFEAPSIFEGLKFFWDTGIAMITDDSLRISVTFDSDPDAPLLLDLDAVFTDPFTEPLTQPSRFVPILPNPNVGIIRPNIGLLEIPLEIRPAVGFQLPGFAYELELNAGFQEEGEILGQPATIVWEYSGTAQVIQALRPAFQTVVNEVAVVVEEQINNVVEQIESGFPLSVGNLVPPVVGVPVPEEESQPSPQPSPQPSWLPDFVVQELQPDELAKTVVGAGTGAAIGASVGALIGGVIGGGSGLLCTAGAVVCVPVLSAAGATTGAQIGGAIGGAIGGLFGLFS